MAGERKRTRRAEYQRQREEYQRQRQRRFERRVFIAGWVLVIASAYWSGGCDAVLNIGSCPDGREHTGECV